MDINFASHLPLYRDQNQLGSSHEIEEQRGDTYNVYRLVILVMEQLLLGPLVYNLPQHMMAYWSQIRTNAVIKSYNTS